jgi:hypothetical protein
VACRSSLEALQQDLDRADSELKEVEGRLHDLEGRNDQSAKQVGGNPYNIVLMCGCCSTVLCDTAVPLALFVCYFI